MSTVPERFEIFLSNAQETRRLGAAILRALDAGDVVALFGQLGAGKSTLAAGIAAELGSPMPAASPTFGILHEHETNPPLYHFDAYRLERPEEFEHIGGEDYLFGSGISVVEWAEKLGEYLPARRIEIKMVHVDGCRSASVSALAKGDRAQIQVRDSLVRCGMSFEAVFV
ncbi:MAG: tRNA (adenosine(37)-N6)-threonylcarbamoyltransferase complex ATPase subunit type 1 TsaE [Planctomycetota bacterium]|nr:tRNA (adenosine(37)-N6)-threonylcarbamoyltransferase complex ATPase subunit type 1 TsaE [Planctomycetota bacterium]